MANENNDTKIEMANINVTILLSFIKQLDEMLDKIRKDIGLRNAFFGDGFLDCHTHPLSAATSVGLFVCIAAIGVVYAFSYFMDILLYGKEHDVNWDSFMLTLLLIGMIACLATIPFYFGESASNLRNQDVNKIVNKQDLALYLVAVAAHYGEEHLEEMSKLAILAVKLSKNPGDFKSAQLIKEAKSILDTLALKATKDLPDNYKLVTVYPKSGNITTLGVLDHHLTLFPVAKEIVKPTERSLLLRFV